MGDPLLFRGEVEALLFNVADVVATLRRIESLLMEDDDEGEGDEG
jgi:hypothetical protein